MDEALPIAKQIAEALEAAHEQGIIHRDLKPANIKLRPDGTVKVLDFGLAKALDVAPEGDPNQSPTLTAAATQMGVIMGTAAYMSPEQARGRPVDKRADIWAFGAVLFEMLTGQRAFEGEDVSLTLASVMKSDFNVQALPSDAPSAIRMVLRRCLEKDPRRRIRDVGDVILALEGEFAVGGTDSPAIAGRPSFWQRPLSVLTIGFVALVLGTLLDDLPGWVSDEPQSEVFRFTVPLNSRQRVPPSPGTGVELSPDGQRLLYSLTEGTTSSLYLRPLDQIDAIHIRGTEGGRNVFWSPDGEWVGFTVANRVMKVALAGGTPEIVCDMTGLPLGASWGPDDVIVFANLGSGLSRVSAAGGKSEPFTTLRPGEASHAWPQVLPDAGGVLFTVGSENGETSIAVKRSGESEHRTVLEGATTARFVSTGHLVFARAGTLWATRFDIGATEVTGQARPSR